MDVAFPAGVVIDLHTHVLPGLDDGPAELEGSIAIAREAAANGVTALAATPHVRDDYPTTPRAMTDALATVREALRDARIDIDVLPGAEVAFDSLRDLDLDELRSFGLAGSPSHLLVELPFFSWPFDLTEQLQRLREAGLTTVLAHPERNSAVQESPQRLADLVRSGVLVQVTAGSLAGGFGGTAARTAKTLISTGLAHLVASDTHRAGGFRTALGPALDGIRDPALIRWLTCDVPAAIVEGSPCPPRPEKQPPWYRGALRRRKVVRGQANVRPRTGT
jgi:protein-tyrosine phosphatase